mmetsp:Transcript_22859/g.49371  ORF Transcript_22859/g.49371 Transcript_22859/m.49371 type:complete len:212 (+) Transcript_22859:432-1067(+)
MTRAQPPTTPRRPSLDRHGIRPAPWQGSRALVGVHLLVEREARARQPQVRRVISIRRWEGGPRGTEVVHVVQVHTRAAGNHSVALHDAPITPLAVAQREKVDDWLEERVWPSVARGDAECAYTVEWVLVPLEKVLPSGVREVEDGVLAATQQRLNDVTQHEAALEVRVRQVVRNRRASVRALQRYESFDGVTQLREKGKGGSGVHGTLRVT